MANYSLVINSKFRPFEFDEMLKPVMIAEQAHREVEDAYSDLMTKTNIWDKLTNPETDKEAHSIYLAYAKDLESQAEDLARYGLNPSSRQQMLNMRARYARDITPIQVAYDTRKEQMKQQAEIMARDPTYRFGKMASMTSLDKYMANPTLNVLEQGFSGALLAKQVGDAMKNLKTALTQKGALQKLGLPYQYERMLQYGATVDDVIAAMSKDPNALPILTQVVDNVIEASGIRKWASNDLIREAEGAANLGLYESLGTTKWDNFTDNYSMQSDLEATRHTNAVEEARENNKVRLKMYDLNSTPYFSRDEITSANNAVAFELDKWKDKEYFTSSGELSPKGLEALRKAGGQKSQYVGISPSVGVEVYSPSTETGDPDFLAWAQRNGVTGKDDPHAVSKLNKYYRDTRAAIASGELATGVANFPAYRQRLGKAAERNLVAENLLNIIGDGVIYEAGQLSNGTITPGAPYDAAAFREAIGYSGKSGENANILYIANAPTVGGAGQQFIELINGKKFLIPNGEQFFGSQTYRDLQGANIKVRNAQSIGEVADNLNRANSYMAAPLTTVGGTEITPNDGTVTIDLLDLLDR